MLTTSDLVFSWPDGPALGPINTTFVGGLHRLTGPNGRGKTTLLRLLCGALPPTSGTVTALGRDVRADPGARAAIGFVPSTAELPDFLTVDEAWQMLAAVRRSAWDGSALREQFGLRGGMALGTLSAGQRRRAEILAQLAGDPPILLLDEPFADLDTGGVEMLARLLESYAPSRTILYVHHGASPIAGADVPIGAWTV